jgi:hypothetical protein
MALLAALVVARRDGDSAGRTAERAAAPMTTTAPSTTTTTTAARQSLATLRLETATLPDHGIGVSRWESETVQLLDDDGNVVATGPTPDARLISPQDVAVATVTDRVVELRHDDDAAAVAPDGCVAGDAVGDVTVKRCGAPSYLPPRLDLVDGRGSRVLIGAPPGRTLGGWRSAKLSPDGRTVLAQWSGECEVPDTFFVDVATGRPTAVIAESSTSAGWRADGSAVIATGRWECGTPGEPGVYAVAPGGRPRLLVRTSSDLPPAIFAWRRDTTRGACELPSSPRRCLQAGTRRPVRARTPTTRSAPPSRTGSGRTRART